MKEWKFQSSSSPKVYTTQISANGLLSCDCPGWTVKKVGKVRECKHTKKVIVDEGLQIVVRNEQQFVVGSGSPVPASQPILNPEGNPLTLGELIRTMENEDMAREIGFISPMLASKMPDGHDADFYASDAYVMEEKFDGHRLIVRTRGTPLKGVQAWSRLGNPRTLPVHLEIFLSYMPEGVYDGELIVPGQHSYDVTEGQNSGTEKLVLFDMLEVLGESVMKEPYAKRRDFLCEAMRALPDEQDAISVAVQYPPSVKKVKEIWAAGGEGAILKNVHSKYQAGWRTPDWVKVKAVNAATLTIIGFEEGKNGPYSIARLRDDAGIETTVKTLDNDTLRQITKNPNGFIGKRLVISYHEKMPSGKYRHPMWDHMAGVGE